MKNFKRKYVLVIILLIVFSLLFFRNDIRGKTTGCSTTVTEVDKQTYDAYKTSVDSYIPIWSERDCYSLFGIEEGPFDHEVSDQLYQTNIKTRVLETNISREYNYSSNFILFYSYDKFSFCTIHTFIFKNFEPVLFEQIRNDIQKEIGQNSDYKKIADFNCNNGNISSLMWEQSNGALTILTSYLVFPEDETSFNYTMGKLFNISTGISTIRKSTSLVNWDKFAYFNYTISSSPRNYCNPNLPIKITFTE